MLAAWPKETSRSIFHTEEAAQMETGRSFFKKMYDCDTRIGIPCPKRKELFEPDL